MASQLSVLCIHGISHSDIDPDFDGSWSKVICDGPIAWKPDLQDATTYDRLKYDEQFEQAPLDKQVPNLSQRPYANSNPSLAEERGHRPSRQQRRELPHRTHDQPAPLGAEVIRRDAQNAQTPRPLPAHPGETASLRIPAWDAIVSGVTYNLAATLRKRRGKEVNLPFCAVDGWD